MRDCLDLPPAEKRFAELSGLKFKQICADHKAYQEHNARPLSNSVGLVKRAYQVAGLPGRRGISPTSESCLSFQECRKSR